MIQMHNLKIQQRFADAKLDSDKLFEVRVDDRYYQKGDLIQYQAITNTDSGAYRYIDNHPINKRVYEITYVYRGQGVEQGYAVLGEQDVTEDYTNKTGKFENLQQLNWTQKQ